MAGVRPLVWVTRDEPPDGRLATELRLRGLDVVVDPTVRTIPLSHGDALARTLTPDDWLVLTSPRAIRLVSGVVAVSRPRVAVVGQSSARLATERGFDVQHISSSRSAAGVWQFLAEHSADRRICFMRSRQAPMPTVRLSRLEVHDLYDVIPRRTDPATLEASSLATFASTSVVRACVLQCGAIPMRAVSIGPATTAALRAAGAHVVGEARYPTLSQLAASAALACSVS